MLRATALQAALDAGQPLPAAVDLRSLIQDMVERMTVQDVKLRKMAFELEMEVGHVNILRAETQTLKQQAVKIVSDSEREEEFIANKLMQRINTLKREKEELLRKVEQEEEQITNTLQRKLVQLQKEKVDIELVLEQEQEFIVNRLQRQLESMRHQQTSGSTPSLNKKTSFVHTIPSVEYPISPTVSPGVVEVLKVEVGALRGRVQELEREVDEARDIYRRARTEIADLRRAAGVSVDDLDTVFPPPPVSLRERRASVSKPSTTASTPTSATAPSTFFALPGSASASSISAAGGMAGSSISGYATSAAMIAGTAGASGGSGGSGTVQTGTSPSPSSSASWAGLDRSRDRSARSSVGSTIELGNWPRGGEGRFPLGSGSSGGWGCGKE
ncbi:hypothetical protein DFJ73DRAFT_592937 [Zopfochytrium polystomum]|nr:hypothetical protein DFJ73DRAFT_592937 [Zopfochytrium polystomum]